MAIDVKLVEESFRKVLRSGDEFISSFYERLFTMYPEVMPLFVNVNMECQREKLLASLMTIINNLRKPEVLSPYLMELGRHHVEYKVGPEHFPMGREALLAAFELFLGDEWTPELRNSWAEAYDETVWMMLEGYK